MDKFAEKLAEWFGSTPFILLHVFGYGSWIALHNLDGFDEKWATLTVIAGVEVIFLSLFILRAENVQSKRFEDNVKHDIKTSHEILGKIDNTIKK